MSATKPEINPESTCAHCGRDMQTFDNVCSSVAYCITISEAYKYPHIFPDAKPPVVDVTRELYLALVYVLRASCLNTSSSAYLQGMKAIKLYQEKVKQLLELTNAKR